MPYLFQSFGFSSSIELAFSEVSDQSTEESFHFLAGPLVGAMTRHSSLAPASVPDNFSTTISAADPPGENDARVTSSRLNVSTDLSRRSSGLLSSTVTAAIGTSARIESCPASLRAKA